MKRKLLVCVILLIFVSLFWGIAFADDSLIKLEIEGHAYNNGDGNYSDDWATEQWYYTDIPSNYNDDRILFRGTTMGYNPDKVDILVKYELDGPMTVYDSETYLDNSKYLMVEVPVNPGERVYFGVKMKYAGEKAYLYGEIFPTKQGMKVDVDVDDASSQNTDDITEDSGNDTSEASTEPQYGYLIIKIQNKDDDTLYISIYIDNALNSIEVVEAADTETFEDIMIMPGLHYVKIKWIDPDTQEEYSSVESVSIEGRDTKTVTLSTSKHTVDETAGVQVIDAETTKEIDEGIIETTETKMNESDDKDKEPKSGADITVKNFDESKVTIKVYIDGERIDTVKLEQNEEENIGFYPLEPGDHEFELKWYDPDVGKDYTSTTEQTIKKDKTIYMNLVAIGHIDTSSDVAESEPSQIGSLDEENEDSEEDDVDVTWVIELPDKDDVQLESMFSQPELNLIEDENEMVELYILNNGTNIAQDVIVKVTEFDGYYQVVKTVELGDIAPSEYESIQRTIPTGYIGTHHIDFDVTGSNFDSSQFTYNYYVFKNQPNTLTYDGKVIVENSNSWTEQDFEQSEEDIQNLSKLKAADEYSESEVSSGIVTNINVYGDSNVESIELGKENVYLSVTVKNTGSYGMWVKIIPTARGADYKWLSNSFFSVDNRYRIPMFDSGIMRPFYEYNIRYYDIGTYNDELQSLMGIAYVVPSETMEYGAVCQPLETGDISVGAEVYHTNSLTGNNELPIVSQNGYVTAVPASKSINIYGHDDESFLIHELDSFSSYFPNYNAGILDVSLVRWIDLSLLKRVDLDRSFEIIEAYDNDDSLIDYIYNKYLGGE